MKQRRGRKNTERESTPLNDPILFIKKQFIVFFRHFEKTEKNFFYVQLSTLVIFFIFVFCFWFLQCICFRFFSLCFYWEFIEAKIKVWMKEHKFIEIWLITLQYYYLWWFCKKLRSSELAGAGKKIDSTDNVFKRTYKIIIILINIDLKKGILVTQ